MAYQSPQQDIVSGEQYRYALTNFRIAHEKVEQQRIQLEDQEKVVAQLRERIALLEGSEDRNVVRATPKHGGASVDDFSIKNAASKLEKLINRWAAEIIRSPPAGLEELRDAIYNDLEVADADPPDATPMTVQNLLRHAVSEAISESIVNCLIVTNSSEANIQLTRIHEHIFSRDPTVACVWRLQTFSAAVDSCTPEMSDQILSENVPTLMDVLTVESKKPVEQCYAILNDAYAFSRMLHGSKSTSGGVTDTFYRAFVPELGSRLFPRQIELIKRCLQSEQGGVCQVGATVFPGLVKVSKGPVGADGQQGELIQTVVRRAQVVCDCALLG